MHRETNLIKSNSNNYLDNINLYENMSKDNGMDINKEKNNKNKNTIIINNNININNIVDKKSTIIISTKIIKIKIYLIITLK